MNLYRILIVDDEEEIRLGIIKKIDWEYYGFDVVANAENGHDALEKAEKFKPHIIMTDIKMPFMDGLELGRKISELMPATKIIIFSGCDEFEYAQKAIQINVMEYIMKPVNSLELIEVLKKLKIKLDNEYYEKRNLEKLYDHYIESLPAIREQFLAGIIEGRISEEEWIERSEKLCINLKNNYLSVALISKERNLSPENEYDYSKVESTLTNISIKKTVDETMGKYCDFISFIYFDKIVVIGNLHKKEEMDSFIKGINEVCNVYKHITDVKISAGIGYVYDDYSQIKFSYKSALNALQYKLIFGLGKVIYINDVEPDNAVQVQFNEQEEQCMVNAIKISSEKEIIKVFNELFCKLQNKVLEFNKYRIYIMEIMTSLLKIIQSYNLDINEIFGDDFNCYVYLDSFNSIDEIRAWFIDKAIKVNLSIKKERINSSSLLVEQAKQYVFSNYTDPELSIDKICSKLHVSPTYFSTIFKRKTETSFINFLTNIRLEEAVRLLNTTQEKTYIIANKVGYQEANYFSYVFKKKFGVAPSRYRKS